MKVSDVSVIVCAYTEARWDGLVAAIESVQCHNILPREIIVVIDHNSGLKARACESLAGVTVVENHEPRGLSGARNSGVAIAQGEVIAFIDEDAMAASDWLEQLIVAYADPHVLGVGGSIEPKWSTRRPRWFPAEFDWVVGCTYRGLPGTTAPVRNLIGCNMSFRREVFGMIAGFHSGIGRVGTLPVGCEETELCIRLKQRQPRCRLLYEPRARVFHRVSAQRAHWRYFLARCYYEGISKASVARMVGASDGLSTERAYALRTLPRGVLRGLTDALLHGDVGGLGRAFAIISGLMLTVLGYARGRFALRTAKHPDQLVDHSTIENLS
jgi:glycosyltransferase involved in cell wall biosynthesis